MNKGVTALAILTFAGMTAVQGKLAANGNPAAHFSPELDGSAYKGAVENPTSKQSQFRSRNFQ